jgi:hypothetical protein
MVANLARAAEGSVLVALVQLVEYIPVPRPPRRRRGRPAVYPDRLFLKARVIMIVRHLAQVHTLLAVLEEPTPEMRRLRALLTEGGRFPARRTWERRLRAAPARLPAQIGCLGRSLVEALDPWRDCGRAAAIDSTVLAARGGVALTRLDGHLPVRHVRHARFATLRHRYATAAAVRAWWAAS